MKLFLFLQRRNSQKENNNILLDFLISLYDFYDTFIRRSNLINDPPKILILFRKIIQFYNI